MSGIVQDIYLKLLKQNYKEPVAIFMVNGKSMGELT